MKSAIADCQLSLDYFELKPTWLKQWKIEKEIKNNWKTWYFT